MLTARYSRIVLFALLAAWALPAWSHGSAAKGRLPIVSIAPSFSLINQSGDRVTMTDSLGKVLVVNFIYTTCKDICPIVTTKMALIQRQLGADFGPRVRFASITVEPEIDSPAVLKAYAAAHGADVVGWNFLTGSSAEVHDVVKRYGSFAKRFSPGEVEHLSVTSIIDARGMLRVQYLGHRFDPDEMLGDLRALLRD